MLKTNSGLGLNEQDPLDKKKWRKGVSSWGKSQWKVLALINDDDGVGICESEISDICQLQLNL